jgi:hypothetical protein
MRRGDFEDIVRRHLDGELEPRGFKLTPQPPADWDDQRPLAVYEAEPGDFNQRYPALAFDADARCVDLWVQLDPATTRISSSLSGPSIEEVTERLGLTRPPTSGPPSTDLGLQLTDLSARLAELLDAAKRHILPERLRRKIASFGESSMGAHRIALVLASGEIVDDVIVAGNEVVRVGGTGPAALPLYAVVDVIDRSKNPEGR